MLPSDNSIGFCRCADYKSLPLAPQVQHDQWILDGPLALADLQLLQILCPPVCVCKRNKKEGEEELETSGQTDNR